MKNTDTLHIKGLDTTIEDIEQSSSDEFYNEILGLQLDAVYNNYILDDYIDEDDDEQSYLE